MHTLTPAQALALIDAQIAAANLPPAHAERARALAYARLELLAQIKLPTITEVPARPALQLAAAKGGA